ncbi:MAG: hypothetical protein COV47_00040 [Candidatus Diapherotrites archaeon CG11_big_fil_rev_8_21_14_0_20_37_9]|nr:MAG: hypothetical protein COV47_00040 [Candidatus Diapherotrites archaeon CG11_big_fil_rev_8_21_14_0_20_37_9]
MKRFCVRCGKETSEMIESICVDCHIELGDLFEFLTEVAVDYDKTSERIRVFGKWLERNNSSLAEFVEKEVAKILKKQNLGYDNFSVEFIDEKEKSVVAKVSFNVTIKGVDIGVNRGILVKFNKTVSDATMKLSSNYHEAIIQLRFNEKPSKKELEEKLNETLMLLKEQKKKIELSEAIEIRNVRGGKDLLVASNKSARIVISKLGAKFNAQTSHSNKLLGTDRHGKTQYRHTYCIRF